MEGENAAFATAVEDAGVAANRTPSILETTRAWRGKLRSSTEAAAALAALVHRVELSRDGLRLSLKVPMPAIGAENDPTCRDAIVTRFVPLQVKRRGVELRLAIPAKGWRDHPPSWFYNYHGLFKLYRLVAGGPDRYGSLVAP